MTLKPKTYQRLLRSASILKKEMDRTGLSAEAYYDTFCAPLAEREDAMRSCRCRAYSQTMHRYCLNGASKDGYCPSHQNKVQR